MKKFTILFCLLFVSLPAAVKAKASDSVVVSDTNQAISILNNAKCYPINPLVTGEKSYKVSEKLFGYIALGWQVKRVVLSNEREGGPNGLTMHDIGMSVAKDGSSFNQNFYSCTTD